MAELDAITRKEKFLAKAAGQDVETPEPITREEMFLSKIAGGGGGGGGLPVVEIHTQIFPQGEGEYIELTADEMAALSAAAETRLPAIIKMYETNVGYRANIFDFSEMGQGGAMYLWVLNADGQQSMYGFMGSGTFGWYAMCGEVSPDE